MKGGELKAMAPEVFKQFSLSRSRNPTPTKRPRLQGFEDGGVIVAAELDWGDEVGCDAGNDVKDEEQQPYNASDDLVLYQRGRKRFRSPEPLDHVRWFKST
jgi:hypothetical protein